jgi:RNA polymerase sigma-B factor
MAQATASRPSDDRLLALYAESPTPSSLEALVERYRPLAHALANRYRRRSEPLDDLLQVADLGLIKAIRGFDPTHQTGFAAYAVPTILGELRRHFRDKVWNLRLPRGLQESSLTVEQAIEHLSGQLGRSPTVRELARETGYSIEDINETLIARDARWAASMDAPVGCDDGESPTALADTLGATDPGYDRVEADYAASTVELDEREWEILRMRFQDEMTQREIGQKLGVSQMQVSRVSRRALAKLLAAVQGEQEAEHAVG